VRIRYRARFREVKRMQNGFDLGEFATTRFPVGADEATSTIAKAVGLGKSSQFLFGLDRSTAESSLRTPIDCTALSNGHRASREYP
jgi:hypothetical protein